MTDFFIYSDLNCPFCYAHNERLTSLGLNHEIKWYGIQHAPHVRSDVCSDEDRAELENEIATIRKRASEITINQPVARPNSGLATAVIIEAQKIDATKATDLLTRLYRALWIEGRDISQKRVIDELVKSADLPIIEPARQTIEDMKRWQREWENGDFDRRIPTTCSDQGPVLVGFPELPVLQAFLSGGDPDRLGNSDLAAACVMVPSQHIWSIDSKGLFSSLTDKLVGALEFTPIKNQQALLHRLTHCEAVDLPDALLIGISSLEGDPLTLCHELKGTIRTHNIPLIFNTDESDLELEVALFDAGAADFMVHPIAAAVFQARIGVHLRLKRTTDMLSDMVRIDGMTQIYNRREFERVLDTEWRRAMRNGTHISLAVIDVDFFKQFNDTYGHCAGDDCLIKIAQTLKASIHRSSDFVARYGGEEFVAILPHADAEGALVYGESARQQIQALAIPHKGSQVSGYISISIGIASTMPQSGHFPSDLFKTADKALYQAKRNGRNRCVVG